MTTHTIPAGNPDTAPPPHPDGGEWTYCVVPMSGELVYSDSLTDLVAAGIPGYVDLPDTDDGHDRALVMRYDDLVSLANKFQRWLVNDAARRELIDISGLGEDALTALMADRSAVFAGVSSQDDPFDWQIEVPLVLMATDYSPFTDRPSPTGRIVWIDPETEFTYLESLSALGVLRFNILTHG
jgi:hypothetical protein